MKLKNLFRLSKKQSQYKEVQVGQFKLIADSNHPIEEYLTLHRYYSRNLPRIAKLITQAFPKSSIIDVGANIGDTVALLRSIGVDNFIYCIEGEPNYFELLKKNLDQFKNTSATKTYLGEENKVEQVGFVSKEGTSKLNIQDGKETAIIKLDTFIEQQNISGVKLLKTDTDGFDFKILRGGLNFIKTQKPVLFFEYDADFLTEQGDDGVSMFDQLSHADYGQALFYDNVGKLLLSTPVNNRTLIEQLYHYTKGRKASFPYYDVCVFPKENEELAKEVLKKETAYFAAN
jgi:FkbM family methyltransferase